MTENQIMNLKEQISSLMGEKFASRAEGYVPEIMHEEVISGNVIHVDETPVKVINQNSEEIRKELGLKETDDLKDREKCYIWVLYGWKRKSSCH